MSILRKIAEQKRVRVGSAKATTPLSELRSRIADSGKPRSFSGALKRNNGIVRLIAEIKKASPSRGLIRSDFDPVVIARLYNERAVDAISVITEEDFFSGSLDYIPQVKEVSSRPVLRKDFLVDEYQLYESRAFGADAVLLIAGLLEKGQASEYLHLAGELGLATLFEVHDLRELEKALLVEAPIIGINNRDLTTLSIDLETTFRLKKEIPGDRIAVSESGIKGRAEVVRLEQAGIDAMLVGTSFMESPDIGKKIDELRGTTT